MDNIMQYIPLAVSAVLLAALIPFLAQLHWSSNIYNMMPFVASMVILAFTSKNLSIIHI